MTLRWFFTLLLLISQTSAGQSTSGGSTTPVAGELQKQIEQIAQSARGRVGVAARLLESNETVAFHGTDTFPMQSVYKFPIGMAVLHAVDQGQLKLIQKVRVGPKDYVSNQQHSPIRDKYPKGTELTLREVLRYAVSESDGSASDVLLRLVGGPGNVMAYLKSLGITGIQVIDTEQAIGQSHSVQYRNWARPEAFVSLLGLLQKGQGLSKSSRELLLNLMTTTPTGLRRLKGRLPAGTPVAHKTGTSGTQNGITAATNDVGILTLPDGRHIAIAVFVSDARADETTREGVIAQIAQAIWTRWK